MYVSDRNQNSGLRQAQKGAAAGPERNSTSSLQKDASATGVLAGFGGPMQSKLSSSARLTNQFKHLPVSNSGAIEGKSKKQERSSAPDIRSQSFNGTPANILFQPAINRTAAAGERAKSRISASGHAGSLDLGQALTRKSAAANFRAPALAVSMPASSKPRQSMSSQQAECTFVLDDMTFTIGHSSFQGSRDYQEDTVSVLNTPTALLGGVFDGHGGDEVSKELERMLLQALNRKVTEVALRDPNDIKAIEAALRTAYLTTNEELAVKLSNAQEAGSCAVTFMIRKVAGRPHLFCANAGDCRAVLYTGPTGAKRATRLSEDHKPHPNVCPSEITRICDAGGCILWGRVQGCLAVSRAFGDRTLQPYVIADPHIHNRPLEPDRDMFMYLASDGVTDMVDDVQGCTIVSEQLARGATTAQAAQALVSTAYHKGSCDNISVLVVRMKRRQPNDMPSLGPAISVPP